MYRVSVLYGTPENTAEFDSYYENIHIPIARKMKGLVRWTLTKPDRQQGEFENVYLVADLYAETKEQFDDILASPEGQAAAADVAKFATGGATFVYGEESEVSLV
ncbi:EthD family reductase [Pseudactinotalea sp. Z1739]|uniref:EthD family reductase n=1 Tax=Pseudactinotalea sp. Z1739 TaxID=3413028 RepID=UPI003C7C076A